MKNSSEYLMIREELMWRLKAIDSLSTFTYTVFVTIIGIALVNEIIELFILPYLIIIPMSLKVANHKYTVGNLCVYLLELENDKKSYFKWEKHRLENSSNKITKNKLIYLGANMDYVLMCLLSASLFWIQYFRINIYFSLLHICVYIIIQILTTLFVFWVTLSYLSIRRIKQQILKSTLNV